MTEESFLESFDTLFSRFLEKKIESGEVNEDELSEIIEPLISDIRDELVGAILENLKQNSPKMLKEHRKDTRDFEERTFLRWKSAFDYLEMIIVIAVEISENYDKEQRPDAAKKEDYTFDALAHLNAKALLVAQEIYCLLRGGFPDGALARWRSLHEICVTAMFIAKHGKIVAIDYLASFSFNARRAAKQYNEYAERADLQPFNREELTELNQICDAAEKQVGRSIDRDFDWARSALQKERIAFFDLEMDVKMDHWRPRYRWASQHTHAGHRPADKLLGMVEAKEMALLVGPSNSGFVDPLQMAAMSLANMISTFFLNNPNLARIVQSDIIQKLSSEIGPLSIRLEEETYRKNTNS